MPRSIPELTDFIKGPRATEVALVLLLLSVGFASFALGRLSGVSEARESVRICMFEESTLAAEENVAPTAEPESVKAENSGTKAETGSFNLPTRGGSYVASKSGEVYHLPWCSGAQRIKEENKVWFATKAEAEAAGYRPAANCKGL